MKTIQCAHPSHHHNGFVVTCQLWMRIYKTKILKKSFWVCDISLLTGGLHICRFGGRGLLHGCFPSILLILLFILSTAVLGNCPWQLPNNSKYIFHFNVAWNECFLESTLRSWIFDKNCVLHQLFIKNQLCVGNLERFLS